MKLVNDKYIPVIRCIGIAIEGLDAGEDVLPLAWSVATDEEFAEGTIAEHRPVCP